MTVPSLSWSVGTVSVSGTAANVFTFTTLAMNGGILASSGGSVTISGVTTFTGAITSTTTSAPIFTFNTITISNTLAVSCSASNVLNMAGLLSAGTSTLAIGS